MLNRQQSVGNDVAFKEISIPVSSMFLSTTRSSTRLNPNLVTDSLYGSSPHTAITVPFPNTNNTNVENLSPGIPLHVVLGSQDTTHHQLVPIHGYIREPISVVSTLYVVIFCGYM